MNLEQLVIGITGAAGFALTIGGRFPRFGLAIILLGQPFWLAESYRAGQTGIFIISLLWTVAWAVAAYKEWKIHSKRKMSDLGK